MKNKRALISLGAGISQIPLIKKAKQNGISVVVVDRDNKAPGASLADQFINKSTYDTQSVIRSLESLNQQYTFDGILHRVSGPALCTAAAITERFDLCGLNEEIARLSTEKVTLRAFCHKNDLPFPPGQKINVTDEIDDLYSLPLVIKPDLPIVGKKDAVVVFDSDQIHSHQLQACNSSYNGFAEIEEYINGIDVSCMFLLNKGRAEVITYWDELVGIERGGHIKGVGVSVPSVISGTQTQLFIENALNKFSKFFPSVYTVLVFSFRVNFQGQIYIIELHADYSGDLILDELMPLANSKIDFFSLILNIVLCKNIRIKQIVDYKPSAIFYKNSSCQVIQENKLERLFDHIEDYDSLAFKPRHLEWFRTMGGCHCQ